VPTARGWLVAAAGVSLVLAGGVFGTQSLWQVGLGLVLLAGAAVAVVRLGKHNIEITRNVSPERARPGQPVTVSIRIANNGPGSAPLMLLEDRVPAGLSGNTRFAIRGVEPQGKRDASMTLRAARRGRYEVGPMEVAFVDPFGLAQLRSGSVGRVNFLVHPKIEPLALPRDQGDRRSLSLSSLRHPTGARGEDFYTLREYVEGDDLRKIHWASTAKRDRYMIRQEETPWQTRATVLLDDRSEVHEGFGGHSSFERAVEAAASVVDLYHRSGYGYRLIGAHEPGVGSGKRAEHRSRCLDLLATIHPVHSSGRDAALLTRLAELERATGAEAALLVVTGTLGAAEALALTRCKRRFAEITVVAFPGHRFSGRTTKARWEGESRLVEAVRMLGRSGVRAVALGPDEGLAPAWSSLFPTRPQEAAWAPRSEPG
jgi:uncharacterized protein (DUF58 family)